MRTRTSVEPGNGLAVRHGATSAAIVDMKVPPMVAKIEETLSAAGWLETTDAFAVQRAARLLARLMLIDAYLDGLDGVGGLVDAKGRPRGCWRLYLTLEKQFAQACDRLGLNPVARASIRQAVASGTRDGLAAQLTARRMEAQGPSTTATPRPNPSIEGDI
jgi:hypothetical protein